MEALVIITALLGIGAWGAVIAQPKLKKLRRKVRPRSRSRRPARSRTRAQKKPAHLYRGCTDAKCKQRLCQVFREGQQACTRTHQ